MGRAHYTGCAIVACERGFLSRRAHLTPSVRHQRGQNLGPSSNWQISRPASVDFQHGGANLRRRRPLVPKYCWPQILNLYNPRVSQPHFCPELQKLRQNALGVFQDVKRIRRSRDLSFFEDAELNGQKHDSVAALIKHLLAGHGGSPCPAGSRPIVKRRRYASPTLTSFLYQR
jgi:hypothetical protein